MKANMNSAFTLIELLVVISIISLLIAILLPALGAARKSSQTVSCATNQRQIGLAMLAYAADYGDHLPTSFMASSITGDPWWTQPWSYRLIPYVNCKMDSSSTPAIQNSLWNGIFHCVAKPNFDINGPTDVNRVSYAMNAFVQGGNTFMRLDQILNPSTLLLLTDTGNENNSMYNYIYTWSSYPAFWHPGQTNNVLMTDNHVEVLKVDGIGSVYKGLVSGNTGFELRKAY